MSAEITRSAIVLLLALNFINLRDVVRLCEPSDHTFLFMESLHVCGGTPLIPLLKKINLFILADSTLVSSKK